MRKNPYGPHTELFCWLCRERNDFCPGTLASQVAWGTVGCGCPETPRMPRRRPGMGRHKSCKGNGGVTVPVARVIEILATGRGSHRESNWRYQTPARGRTSLPVFYKGRPIHFSVEQMRVAVMTISALQMMRTAIWERTTDLPQSPASKGWKM